MSAFTQQLLDVHDELIVDNFAGGGGASAGIEEGLGRQVDIAINHDPVALSVHQANHPQTKQIENFKVISLGAGVQSSAMLLMALEGRFGEKPNCAVFADTEWEPKAVYEWLEKLEREVYPFQIHHVTWGNIRTDAEAGQVPTEGQSGKVPRRFASLPFHLKTPLEYIEYDDAGEVVSRTPTNLWVAGMGRRQCSSEYKIKPIRKWVRETCKRAEIWIGISTDEAVRMKPSNVQYITHRWPLIEHNLSREACAKYLMDRMGSVAPKSSCIGCPFHDDAYWARLKAESPQEFDEAVAFDNVIRRTGRMKADQFVHRSLIPLGEIKEFRHERQGRMFIDAFGNECQGVCGT